MNNPEKENLRELLAGFMDADSAARTAEDIEKGDELLRSFAAPQPTGATLAQVNRRIAEALRQRHSIRMHRTILAAAGVAAAIFIASIVALRLLESQPPAEKTSTQYAAAIPDRIWEGSPGEAGDDADISVLTAEVKTIENELQAMLSGNDSSNGSGTLDELEIELIEMSGDFWKG